MSSLRRFLAIALLALLPITGISVHNSAPLHLADGGGSSGPIHG
jgi:hypothetical protein